MNFNFDLWQNGLLYTGCEDSSNGQNADHRVIAWDTNSGKVAFNISKAHSKRVKGIVVLARNAGAGADDDPYLVASASSDGVIRVWDVRMATKEKPNPLAEANTKSRLTCLAGASLRSSRQPRIGKNNSQRGNDASTEDMTS